MKYTREMIIERLRNGEKLAFLPFCHEPADPKQLTEVCLNLWFDCRFVLFEREYRSVAQYMAVEKAELFADRDVLKRITEADNPQVCRALGDEVKRFDAAIWDQKKCEISLMGNLAKFSQNPELWAYLDSTADGIRKPVPLIPSGA